MPKMVAIEDVSLPNAHYAAGDEFSVNDAVAHILRMTGKVKDKDAAPKRQEALNTKDQIAEEDPPASKRANRYPRRDLRAQED